MNSEKIYNCNDCLYANLNEDNSVTCDKVFLLYGRYVHIPTEKVKLSCPSHSGKFIEEWRYMRPNKDIRDAEDACDVCGRLVNEYDDTQYDYVDVEGEEGNVVTVMKCRICIEKGR